MLYAILILVLIVVAAGIYIVATSTVQVTGTVRFSRFCSNCEFTSLRVVFVGNRGYAAGFDAVGNSTRGFKYQGTVGNHQTYVIIVTGSAIGFGPLTLGAGSFDVEAFPPTMQPIVHDITL